MGCRYTTAYRAILQQGKLCEDGGSNDKTVAIFGCGGLGLSCLAIASAFGAKRIIAVDVSKNALDKAKELGASSTILSNISYQEQQSSPVYESIMKLTDGIGADLTVDAGGFKQTCSDAVWCCRRGGIMVQVGLPANPPALPMARIAGREITVVGSHGFSAAEDGEGFSALDHILHLVETGKLQPKQLIEKEVSLEEGVRELMNMNKSSPTGMVMITDFTSSLNSKL